MKKEEVLKQIQSVLCPNFGGKMFSNGNKKLGKGHLIVNLTSATNCPSKQLGLCEHCKSCYAFAEENIFKQYKKRNIAVEEWFKTASVVDIVDIISAYLVFYGNGKNKIKYIRLNESGDFADQEMVDKMSEVAYHFKYTYNIETYGWTARNDLDFSNVHFILNASNPDTNGAIRRFVTVRQSCYDSLPKKITYDDLDEETKTFVGSAKDYKDEKFIRCKGDCSICGICRERRFKGVVLVRSHGVNASK